MWIKIRIRQIRQIRRIRRVRRIRQIPWVRWIRRVCQVHRIRRIRVRIRRIRVLKIALSTWWLGSKKKKKISNLWRRRRHSWQNLIPTPIIFYLMRDELIKIDEYMTSFSKIARKNWKGNKHCHVLHSIHSHRRSKLFIIEHTIAKDYFKDIFWDCFSFNKFFQFSFIS